MADTKISGLAAAASMLDTHEFPVNEAGVTKKVTGAQIRATVAKGTLGYAQVTANQTGISAVTDLTGLTLTVTAAQVNGRRIRISGKVKVVQNTAPGITILSVKEGATVLTQDQFTVPAGNAAMLSPAVVLLPTNAAHPYKFTLEVGAGTVDLNASATQPAFILIEDIGT